MTSVGSVSIDLSLDRSRFDRDLQALGKTTLPPIDVTTRLDTRALQRDLQSLSQTAVNLDIQLNRQTLERQFRDIRNGDYGAINVNLSVDAKAFERKLKNLPKSLVEPILVEVSPDVKGFQEKLKGIAATTIECLEVCLHPDIEGFRRKLDALYKLDNNCLPIKICPELDDFLPKVKQQVEKVRNTVALNVVARLDTTQLSRDLRSSTLANSNTIGVALQHKIDTSRLDNSFSSATQNFRNAGTDVGKAIADKLKDVKLKTTTEGKGLLGSVLSVPAKLLGGGVNLLSGILPAVISPLVKVATAGADQIIREGAKDLYRGADVSKGVQSVGRSSRDFAQTRGTEFGEVVSRDLLLYEKGLAGVAEDLASIGKKASDFLHPEPFFGTIGKIETRFAKFLHDTFYGAGLGTAGENLANDIARPFEQKIESIKKLAYLVDTQIANQLKQLAKGEIKTKDLSPGAREVYTRIATKADAIAQSEGLTSKKDRKARVDSLLKDPAHAAELVSQVSQDLITEADAKALQRPLNVLLRAFRITTGAVRKMNALELDRIATDLAHEYADLIPDIKENGKKLLTIYASAASDFGRGSEEHAPVIQAAIPGSNVVAPTYPEYYFKRGKATGNIFHDFSDEIAKKAKGSLVAGPVIGGNIPPRSAEILTDTLSGFLFGYSKTVARNLAVRKAALAKGYEPENIQIGGFSAGSQVTRNTVDTLKLLNEEIKGFGVGIGDFFEALIPVGKNYRSIIAKGDTLNLPLTEGLVPGSGKERILEPSIPNVDAHALPQVAAQKEFLATLKSAGIKGVRESEGINEKTLAYIFKDFTQLINSLRTVKLSENIRTGKPINEGIVTRPTDPNHRFAAVEDFTQLVKTLKSGVSQFKQFAPDKLAATAKEAGVAIDPELLGVANAAQIKLTTEISALASQLGVEGKTVKESLSNLELVKPAIAIYERTLKSAAVGTLDAAAAAEEIAVAAKALPTGALKTAMLHLVTEVQDFDLGWIDRVENEFLESASRIASFTAKDNQFKNRALVPNQVPQPAEPVYDKFQAAESTIPNAAQPLQMPVQFSTREPEQVEVTTKIPEAKIASTVPHIGSPVTTQQVQQVASLPVEISQVEKNAEKSIRELLDMTRAFEAAAATGKQLKKNNPQYSRTYAQTILANAERAIEKVDKALSAIPKGERTSTLEGNQLSNFKSRLTAANNKAKEILRTTVEQVGSSKSVTLDAGKGIASDVAAGLKGGITKEAGGIKKAGQLLGEVLIEGAEEELEIKSPSKKGERVGFFTIEGLIEGLKQNSSRLKLTTQKVIGDSLDFSKSAIEATKLGREIDLRLPKDMTAAQNETVKQAAPKTTESHFSEQSTQELAKLKLRLTEALQRVDAIAEEFQRVLKEEKGVELSLVTIKEKLQSGVLSAPGFKEAQQNVVQHSAKYDEYLAQIEQVVTKQVSGLPFVAELKDKTIEAYNKVDKIVRLVQSDLKAKGADVKELGVRKGLDKGTIQDNGRGYKEAKLEAEQVHGQLQEAREKARQVVVQSIRNASTRIAEAAQPPRQQQSIPFPEQDLQPYLHGEYVRSSPTRNAAGAEKGAQLGRESSQLESSVRKTVQTIRNILETGLGEVDAALGTNISKVFKKQSQQIETELEKNARAVGQDLGGVAAASVNAAVKQAETAANHVNQIRQQLQRDVLPVAQSGLQGFVSAFKEGFNGLEESFPIVGKATRLTGDLIKGFLAFQGVFIIQNAVVSFAKGATEAAIALDKLQTSLDYASGGAAAGAKNLAFVRSEVDRLKIPLAASQEGFAQLSAATKKTELEGQTTKDVFTGIAEASTVLSLSADQSSGALLALTQIASKGSVQAEELRGQLGERIPGAFSIAARAMGVTEAQLNKMLETGQVLASDFLPRFAQQLHTEFGDAAVTASNNAQSAIFDLQNQTLKLQESFGKTVQPAFVLGLNTASGAMKLLADNAGSLLILLGEVAFVIAVPLLEPIFKLLAKLPLVEAGITGIKAGFTSLVASAGPMLLTFAAIETALAIFQAGNVAVNGGPLVQQFKDLDDAAKKGIETLKGLKEQADITLSRPAAAPTDYIANFLNSTGRNLLDLLPEGKYKEDRIKEFPEKRLRTYADLDAEKEVKNLKDNADQITSQAEIAQKKISDTLAGKTALSKLPSLDVDIQKLKNRRATLTAYVQRDFTDIGKATPTKFTTQLYDLNEQYNKAVQSRQSTAKSGVEDFASLNRTVEATKLSLQSLNDPATINKFGGETVVGPLRKKLEEVLPKITAARDGMSDLLASTKADPILTFTDAIRKLNLELGKNAEATQLAFLKQREGIAQRQVATFSTSITATQQASLDNAKADRDRLSGEVKNLETDLASRQQSISTPEFQPVLAKFGLTNSSTAADVQGAIDRPSTTDADKKVLDQIKAVRDAETKLHETRTQFYQSKSTLQQQNQQNALNNLTRYAADTQAVNQQIADKGTINVKNQLAARQISEKQAAVLQTKLDANATARSLNSTNNQLVALRNYYAQGRVGAQEFHDKERELLVAQSGLKKTLREQEITAQQAEYDRFLTQLQDAIAEAKAITDESQTNRKTNAKVDRLEILKKGGDQKAADLQQASTNADADIIAAKERIALTQYEMRENDRNEKEKRLDARTAKTERLRLNKELASDYDQLLTAQLAKEQNNQQIAIHNIEVRVQRQKNQSDLAVANIDREKSAQDLLNKSLERSKTLLESRYNLQKALSDAIQSEGQIQVDGLNNALELRKKLDDKTLDHKERRETERQLRELGFSPDTDQLKIIKARQAIEDDIAERKLRALKLEQAYQRQSLELDLRRQQIAASIAEYDARSNQLKARQAVVAAQGELDKAKETKDPETIKTAQTGLELAQQGLDLAGKQVAAAQDNLRVQPELAQNAIAAQRASQGAAIDSAYATERGRQNAESIERVKAGGTGFNLLNSAEGQESLRLGLNPRESAEDYQNRYLGINPRESAEAYQNRYLGLRPSPVVGQLQDAGKVVDKVKPVDGFSRFTEGLKLANRGIEERLDKLITAHQVVAHKPTVGNLIVSSPQPVSDASKVMLDIARQGVVSAGYA